MSHAKKMIENLKKLMESGPQLVEAVKIPPDLKESIEDTFRDVFARVSTLPFDEKQLSGAKEDLDSVATNAGVFRALESGAITEDEYNKIVDWIDKEIKRRLPGAIKNAISNVKTTLEDELK